MKRGFLLGLAQRLLTCPKRVIDELIMSERLKNRQEKVKETRKSVNYEPFYLAYFSQLMCKLSRVKQGMAMTLCGEIVALG